MTPEEACAVYCRVIPSCGKCSRFGKCKHPSRLGLFAWRVDNVCNKARYLLPSSYHYKAEISLKPAVLDDDPEILLKIIVRIRSIHKWRTLYLFGNESEYIVMRQIFKAWREMVREDINGKEENENETVEKNI